MTNTKFIEWLKSELENREWSPAELARKSKLSPAQITRLLNGERGIGEKGLNSIAHALRLAPEFVFEKAGILPTKPELSPIKRKLAHLAQDLPDSDVEMAIAMLEQRSEYYRKNPSAKPAR